MNLIIVGGPGAGKGSLANCLIKDLGIPHVSSGDICRENINLKTPLGHQIEGYLKSGGLVPDAVISDVIFKRLAQPDCKRGFLLDGFPRTLHQAEMLKQKYNIDFIVRIETTTETVIGRLCGRYMCRNCGTIHNKLWHPITKCRECGGELYQREDDTEAVIRNRLEKYHAEEKPIIDFYEKEAKAKSKNAPKILTISSDIKETAEVVYDKFKKQYGTILGL